MDDFQKRIIKVSFLFFIATGVAIFVVQVNMVEYRIPDPPNYITIIVEVAIGFFIATLVYMITKKQQSDSEKREKLRILEEHQYYKERLFGELSIFVSRADTAIHMYLKNIQRNNMLENINLARMNLQRLYQINSTFSIPPDITSKCDNVLAHYHSTLDIIDRQKGMEPFLKTSRTFLANSIQECLNENFFSENNNEKIEKNLTRLEDQLRQILSKDK